MRFYEVSLKSIGILFEFLLKIYLGISFTKFNASKYWTDAKEVLNYLHAIVIWEKRVRERARFLCIIIIILHHKRIIIYDQCFCAYIVKCNPTFDKYMYVYLYMKLRLIIIIIKLATKSLKRVHPSCFYFSKKFPTLFIENVLMLIKRKFF